MSKHSFRLLITTFVVGILMFGALVSTNTVSAQSSSNCELIEMLITAGVIPPENASAARLAFGCPSPVQPIHPILDVSLLSKSIEVSSMSESSLSQANGSFKFKATAISDDVWISKNLQSAINVEKNGEIVGKASPVILTSNSGAEESTAGFLVEEGDTETFTMNYVMFSLQASEEYRAKAIMIPLIGEEAINLDGPNNQFVSDIVYVYATGSTTLPTITVNSSGITDWSRGLSYGVPIITYGVQSVFTRLSSVSGNTVYDSKSYNVNQNGKDNVVVNVPSNFPAGDAKLYVISQDNSNVYGTFPGYLNIIGTSTTCAPMLTRDLTIGSSGSDVTALQNYLIAKGYFTGPATGYFGATTRTAVTAYQVAKNISPANGYVGPVTRAVISSDSCTPSIVMTDAVGNQGITVSVGDTFTLQGTPQNLQGLQYWYGSGYPYGNYYNRAYFFSPMFNDSCSNNEASVDGVWTITCKANTAGVGEIYVEIYKDGQIYRSNIVTVTVLPSLQPPVTVDLKINGSDGPLVLNDNQKITASWTSNSTGCYITNVRLKPGSINQTVENLPANGSRVFYSALSDGNNGVIALQCSNSSDEVRTSLASIRTNQPPVISGVTAPTTLTVNQTGNWTVNASDPENGPLTYSVNWNAGPDTVITSASANLNSGFTQTTTFTHSYSTAGTYLVKFSVKDNGGLVTQTSSTVVVTGNTVVVPTCTSFTYSSWSTCNNGTQTRTVNSKSPSGCTGGSPVLSQSCTVVVAPAYAECGTAQNQPSSALAPTSGLCKTGGHVVDSPAPTGGSDNGARWWWSCDLTPSAPSLSYCFTPRTNPSSLPTIWPACGSSAEVSSVAMPTSNLCNVGTLGNSGSTSENPSRWYWSCIGQNNTWEDNAIWCFAPKSGSAQAEKNSFFGAVVTSIADLFR